MKIADRKISEIKELRIDRKDLADVYAAKLPDFAELAGPQKIKAHELLTNLLVSS